MARKHIFNVEVKHVDFMYDIFKELRIEDRKMTEAYYDGNDPTKTKCRVEFAAKRPIFELVCTMANEGSLAYEIVR